MKNNWLETHINPVFFFPATHAVETFRNILNVSGAFCKVASVISSRKSYAGIPQKNALSQKLLKHPECFGKIRLTSGVFRKSQVGGGGITQKGSPFYLGVRTIGKVTSLTNGWSLEIWTKLKQL